MCAVVWTAPETMPSARPSTDHHRAEVADVDDDVARLLDGDALVRAQRRVLLREPRSQRLVVRVDELGVADVQAELGGLRA